MIEEVGRKKSCGKDLRNPKNADKVILNLVIKNGRIQILLLFCDFKQVIYFSFSIHKISGQCGLQSPFRSTHL